jgi:hypothetical protein
MGKLTAFGCFGDGFLSVAISIMRTGGKEPTEREVRNFGLGKTRDCVAQFVAGPGVLLKIRVNFGRGSTAPT